MGVDFYFLSQDGAEGLSRQYETARPPSSRPGGNDTNWLARRG